MSKFPATIRTAYNAKALHHTIPSAFEGRPSVDVLLELFEDDVFFIFIGLRVNVCTLVQEGKCAKVL